MGTKYNAQAILAGFKKDGIVSKEENDLNININAEHEGDKASEDTSEFEPAAKTVETVETEEVVEPVVETVVEDTSGTPEAVELDVQDAGVEIEETETQIADINEAAEGLEGIALTLAQISYEGLAVSPLAAQMLNDHYAFVTRKFPKLAASEVVASCESFRTDSVEATNVSLESVVEKIKKAGQAMAKMLKDLLQQFLAFLGNVVSASGVMKRKADALQEKAKAYKGEAKEVAIATQLTSKELSVASIKELADLLNDIGTKAYEQFTSINAGTGDSDIDDMLKNGPFVESLKKHFGKTFIGGFKLENTTGGPALSGVEGKEGVKVKLSASEAAALASAVANLAQAIEAYKRGESVRKKVLLHLTGVSEGIDAVEEERKPRFMQTIRRAIRAISQQMAFEKRLVSKALNVGNTVNNIVASAVDGKAEVKE